MIKIVSRALIIDLIWYTNYNWSDNLTSWAELINWLTLAEYLVNLADDLVNLTEYLMISLPEYLGNFDDYLVTFAQYLKPPQFIVVGLEYFSLSFFCKLIKNLFWCL